MTTSNLASPMITNNISPGVVSIFIDPIRTFDWDEIATAEMDAKA